MKCGHCGKTWHLIGKCYQQVGYLADYKLKRKKNIQANLVNVQQEGQMTISEDQYKEYSLWKQMRDKAPMSEANANMTGSLHWRVKVTGREQDRLYILNTRNNDHSMTEGKSMIVSRPLPDLWHRRLGHVPMALLPTCITPIGAHELPPDDHHIEIDTAAASPDSGVDSDIATESHDFDPSLHGGDADEPIPAPSFNTSKEVHKTI
ncbi:hypothetical protein KY284_027112 [Solanum tuberosum]|nr:hypothetical protein KY284_027112 [Solanum tuberosum]